MDTTNPDDLPHLLDDFNTNLLSFSLLISSRIFFMTPQTLENDIEMENAFQAVHDLFWDNDTRYIFSHPFGSPGGAKGTNPNQNMNEII